MTDFSTFLKEEHAEFLVVKDNRLKPSHLEALLAEYKEIAIRNLIDQFGVGTFINVYKEGGNVTTLHNARNDVFATNDDEDRFTYQYNRKEKRTKDMYDSKLPGMRKAKFRAVKKSLMHIQARIFQKMAVRISITSLQLHKFRKMTRRGCI